jgi:hypothetical protein
VRFSADRRRLGLGALVLPFVAAGGLFLPAVGGARSAHAAGAPPACTTSQLVPTIGSPNGAAGTIYMTVTFSNVGSACTMHGFPGVQAVARDGSSLGNAGRVSMGAQITTITLKGANAGNFPRAKAGLGIVDTGVLPHCRTVPAVALRITPPNQTTFKTVPLPFEACSHGPSVLKISQVDN